MNADKLFTCTALSFFILSCGDSSTGTENLELSSSSSDRFSSSLPVNSNSSRSESSSIFFIERSSSSAVLSSTIQTTSSSLSSSFASSSFANPSSSTLYSSSQQPLQFLHNQVRIPDGCGTIQWASGPEKTCVTDFWVDTTEVTIEAYQTLMGGGIPSLYHNGYYRWWNSDHTAYVDDGSLCPTCPADKLTIFEAMLYANALTKSVLRTTDTVYSYTTIDSADAPGYYLKVKTKEVVGLQNLNIDDSKSGFRLPTRGEFHYLCLKSNLVDYPWEDLYPDSSQRWIGTDGYDLFVWSNQNSGTVTHPVASKKGTSWHLYDLLGNADEWTTTPNQNYPGTYMALGGSAELNGYITSDLRYDENRAGLRLVRGKSLVEKGLK